MYKEKLEFFEFSKISKVDAIIHLAAQPSVPISITDFCSSSSANILGTIKVIEYCRKSQIPFIYASSSAIYGELDVGDDSKTQVDLLSTYATDKYAMELYAKTAFRLYNMSSVGLRFFNVYGPRQDPSSPYSGVISIFADKLLKNKDIVINGGHQVRDFVYIRDVVNVIYKSVIIATEKKVCEQINVLTGKVVSIDKLASMLIDKTGASIQKIYKTLPPGDPVNSSGSFEKMSMFFDIKASQLTKLEKGLSDTVDFIKSQ